MDTEPKYVAETLAWCNDRRAEQGQPPLAELPLGVREDPKTCPCGAATGLYVESTAFARSRDDYKAGVVEPLPQPVRKFVDEFDMGFLPQYTIGGVPEYEDEAL